MKNIIKTLFYKPDNKKIYPLYTLRFIFFIFIFVHHIYNNVQISWLRQPALAVSGFIILSGFLNGYIYVNKNYKIKESFKFTINRIKKFWPLHILLLIIMIAISGIFSSTSFSELLIYIKKIFCNALLIQSWINDKSYYFSFNGATWFLSTYMFLCLTTIPIIYLLKKVNNNKHKNIILLIISIIIYLITLIIVYYANKNNLDTEYWLYIFPPARIFEYTIGILFGIIFNNIKINFKYDKLAFSLFELGTLILLIYTIYFNSINETMVLHRRLNLWIIPIILLIFTFSYQKGIITKILSIKPLVKLGVISMYMYLIHQPLIILITKCVGHQIHYRYFALYILILTIIIGTIINKYYEKKNNIKIK